MAGSSRAISFLRPLYQLLSLANSIFSDLNLIVQPPIRLLIFDDDAIDAELMRRALRKHRPSFQVRHVCTDQEYLVALRSFSPDVILSDYKLPLYGAAFALKMARELCPKIPFILVSGTMADGLATELLRLGARAYVSKDNLEKLGPAVDQALVSAVEPPAHGRSSQSPAPS